jgi:hypothetical protein
MKKLEFESARDRIGKAFGRPPIAPAPIVVEVIANRPRPWGEPRKETAKRPPRSWGGVGVAVLCAAACPAIIVGVRDQLHVSTAPFNATAPVETWTPVAGNDDATTMPDHVTGADLDARCEQLWTLLDAQIDIIHEEEPKPGFTRAYRSASRLGLLTARQIQSQGCPVKDEATFDAQNRAIEALNRLMQQ